MNFFKRAMTSIFRRLGKSMVLMVLVLVLGSLMAGAITVKSAIVNTEMSLKRNMPPVVAVELDWISYDDHGRTTGEWGNPTLITPDEIKAIGELPYVSHFNYSTSAGLQSFDVNDYTPVLEGNTENFDMPGWPTYVNLVGVSRAEILEIEQGIIDLVAGRTFLEEEMSEVSEEIPIVLSLPLATENNWSVGSTFTLSTMIPNPEEQMNNATVIEGSNASTSMWEEENLLFKENYTFVIVGLFDIPERRTDLSAANDEDWNEFNKQWSQLNRVFVPTGATEMINDVQVTQLRQIVDELGLDPVLFDLDEEREVGIVAPIFVLNDPLEIEDFREAVEPMLPEFYIVSDVSSAFSDIESSMESMLWIADIVLVVSIVTTLLILSLLITLFLRDRRYEMGIYLALGEKKIKIITQILFEVLLVSVIGLTCSILIGHFASTQLSQTMLRNELVHLASVPEQKQTAFGMAENLDMTIFVPDRSPETLMEAFDVTLSGQSIGLLYGIGISTVIISTLVPVFYITRLNPKKILMEANS